MYKTKTFCELYETVNDFVYDYNNIGIPKIISVDSVTTLYYLLYARYGNSPISNMDENQAKFKLFGVIWQYGPTWEKKLEIQADLRGLSDAELQEGALSIFNHAFNPSAEPSTASETELDYINEQNTTRQKRSKVGAYMELWQALSTDVTNAFLDRFAICFKQFVGPEKMVIYETNEDDD
jgi:hypothetical protein